MIMRTCPARGSRGSPLANDLCNRCSEFTHMGCRSGFARGLDETFRLVASFDMRAKDAESLAHPASLMSTAG